MRIPPPSALARYFVSSGVVRANAVVEQRRFAAARRVLASASARAARPSASATPGAPLDAVERVARAARRPRPSSPVLRAHATRISSSQPVAPRTTSSISEPPTPSARPSPTGRTRPHAMRVASPARLRRRRRRCSEARSAMASSFAMRDRRRARASRRRGEALHDDARSSMARSSIALGVDAPGAQRAREGRARRRASTWTRFAPVRLDQRDERVEVGLVGERERGVGALLLDGGVEQRPARRVGDARGSPRAMRRRRARSADATSDARGAPRVSSAPSADGSDRGSPAPRRRCTRAGRSSSASTSSPRATSARAIDCAGPGVCASTTGRTPSATRAAHHSTSAAMVAARGGKRKMGSANVEVTTSSSHATTSPGSCVPSRSPLQSPV